MRGAKRLVPLAAVLLISGPLGGCAVNTGLMGSFADQTSDQQAVKQVKKTENDAEPSLSQRLSALWNRATASSEDDELETVAPAESFEPAEALALVNRYREDNGLPPLDLDPQLEQAALAHAQDLADHDRISHFGSDGSDPWERVQRTGYDPKVAAENVGTGQLTFGELFREWKRSPDHNSNLLLPDATHMGVAVVQNPDTQFKTFWSLVVGAPS
ncbi:Cysteine-rich secretory protein family protein [Dichotomicrobium thermohalophilum]|uniref:Cysteine-rich secretory protein family protein n=2 Tax=Dichotomicrobium thermohalophilum TaxID=933063 RepID=A0A397Q2U5_9HYPH|nr:Cysteine-rich secretory protein family protein [Dichotomicrobium thermohalophilum]